MGIKVERGLAGVNGTQLVDEVSGAGRAVAFVHGLTLDHRMWDDQAPDFAQQYRVPSYDLRGFGASAPEVGEPYTHAGDLRALLNHLGITRAAVVGLSMGGWVALEFALTYPEALDALVLVDSSLRNFAFGPQFDGTLQTLHRLGREDRPAKAKSGWLADPLVAGSRGFPEVVKRLEQIVEDHGCWRLQHDDPHLPLEPPAIDRLHDIGATMLVVVGEHDLPDFHTIAELLATSIPGARKQVLPDAGHIANMDAPKALDNAVLTFLSEIHGVPA
jgi:pimeloyl-ACP methyl ester carboxylesterase